LREETIQRAKADVVEWPHAAAKYCGKNEYTLMNDRAPTSSEPALTIKREEAADFLRTQIEEGRKLENRTVENERDLDAYRQDVNTWNDYNESLIRRIIVNSDESNRYSEYTGEFVILSGYPSLLEEYNLQEEYNYLKGDVQKKNRRLLSLLERLHSFSTLDT